MAPHTVRTGGRSVQGETGHRAVHAAGVWAALFDDGRRFYGLFTAIAVAIAILKGLRRPIPWAATQVQLDYSFGFVKRGLFGEVCRLAGIPIYRYSAVVAVSFAILACFLLVLWWFARSSPIRRVGEGVLALLFASSFALTYLVSLAGYFDILLGLFVLVVLALPSPRLQLGAAVLAAVVGVLLHEMYAVVFLPVTLLGYAHWAWQQDVSRRRSHRLVALACAYLLPWLLVFFLSLHRPFSTARAGEVQAALAARVDFPLNPLFFEVLSSSLRDNIAAMLFHARSLAWLLEQGFAALVFLPTTVFLLVFALRFIPESPRGLRLFVVFSSLSPLLMYAVGYDGFRWEALACLNAFIACAYLARISPDAFPAPVPLRFHRLALLLVALNLASDAGLFIHGARSYPFYSYVREYEQRVMARRGMPQP